MFNSSRPFLARKVNQVAVHEQATRYKYQASSAGKNLSFFKGKLAPFSVNAYIMFLSVY